MVVNYCDVCQKLIKPTDSTCLLGVHKLTVEEDVDKTKATGYLSEAIRNNIEYEKISIVEICEDCKKLVEYFLSLKRYELQKVQEEINQIWKMKVKKGKRNDRI